MVPASITRYHKVLLMRDIDHQLKSINHRMTITKGQMNHPNQPRGVLNGMGSAAEPCGPHHRVRLCPRGALSAWLLSNAPIAPVAFSVMPPPRTRTCQRSQVTAPDPVLPPRLGSSVAGSRWATSLARKVSALVAVVGVAV